MKKLIKAIIGIIIFIILILAFRFGGLRLLNNAALSFRPWVDTVTVISVGILANVVVVLIIMILAKMLKNQNVLKGMYVIGIVLCIGLGLYSAYLTLLGLVLGYNKEHVVERDKTKMVAVVDSFLEVNVHYYPYKNWIVMGNNKLLTERYGSGGYDPLDGNHVISPKETTYYYERE